MGSAPVGAPSGATVTAAEGRMPTVQGIDARAKQIARQIVDKAARIAAKAKPSLIGGKVMQIANRMGVKTPIVAKATVTSAV